jgi:isoleucyl-tRNA synthetase
MSCGCGSRRRIIRNDIVVSEERVNKVGETYRAIRNALRYQLSNLYDFDPANIPCRTTTDRPGPLDSRRFSKLEAEVIAAYDQYEFHVVYQKVSQFVAVELSSIYHDVIKDRLYTDPANSPRRRSTQTALHRLVRGLCQMLSPMLVFTADEAWEFVGICRQAKTIGKSLEGRLIIAVASQTNAEVAEKFRDDFRELINLSQISFERGAGLPVCTVQRAEGQKCERCWRWELDVGRDPEHPTLCGRCVEAVKQFRASKAGGL